MKEPVPYATTEERLTLGDGEVAPGKRMRARAACASHTAAFAWMNIDVCVSRLGGTKPPKIASSRELVAFLFDVFPVHEMSFRETFVVVCLDSKNQPIGTAIVSKGGIDSAAIDMKTLFKTPVLLPASGMALCHNHPSGDPSPSSEDIMITERIMRGAELLGIRVLDHIILTDKRESYFSFLDAGILARK
jgi:DNA repair protein RadC